MTAEESFPSPLRKSRILATTKSRRFRDVKVLGVVTSTNDVAERLAARGGAIGTVVFADGQTRGRGRRGDRWVSPPGSGLFVTAIVEAPAPGRAPLLAGAAGVAAAAAITAASGAEARVKWPNDLWIRDRKVGGILIEVPGREPSSALVGIGITLDAPPGIERAQGAASPAGIRELGRRDVGREALAAALLDGLAEALDLAARRPDELQRRYRALDVLTGRRIVAETPEGTIEGLVERVDLLDGIDVALPDRSHRRLRPEHTHITAVLPGDRPA